jgi:NADPH-dependent 2,4-dienoyl-CoA reductase/sulfur reductase-like enzyme
MIEPLDEHNLRLIANVHPTDWTNPEPAGRYHLVVIGAGTAGLVSAAGAAGLGAKVAIIERHLMGGGGPRRGRALRRTPDRGLGRFRSRHGADAPPSRRHQRP